MRSGTRQCHVGRITSRTVNLHFGQVMDIGYLMRYMTSDRNQRQTYSHSRPHANSGLHGPLTRYAKLRVVHATGMPGTFSPPPRGSDPDMHQGTCVTPLSWFMPGSITSGFFEVGGGENVPDIPGTCITRNFAYLVRVPCLNAVICYITLHHQPDLIAVV